MAPRGTFNIGDIWYQIKPLVEKWAIKKTDELFTGFRDLARGLHLDNKVSEAAVRQSINNISSLAPEVKA